MNFAERIAAAPPESRALIEVNRSGKRREWTYGEVSDAAARFAGRLQTAGIGPGDVVLIWLGNRAEWVLSMLGCFRLGAVAAACPEQLRANDLFARIEAASPALIVADERNREELALAKPPCPTWWIPDEALWLEAPPAAATPLKTSDPCLITFTSGTSGAPKAVLHAQRYLDGQRLQAEHWLGARPGEVTWCTASTGWSKSARNAFVAPWLCGATALLHDARFDPEERLSLIEREEVRTLCMAPTEYRIIAKRATIRPLPTLDRCVAAGEALDPGIIETWREGAGVEIRDGYGQTETGQLTGFGPTERVRPGSMGRALPGIRLWIEDGVLRADPATVPTFFDRYLDENPVDHREPWNTGDRADIDEDGYLWSRGRADDIIISAGYRIGPVEIEAALTSHPAVEEAAAVAAPDEERGAVVRAVVVLRAGHSPSAALVERLQSHVKAETAPYKYPRVIDFVDALPKTSSGKIRRAALREH